MACSGGPTEADEVADAGPPSTVGVTIPAIESAVAPTSTVTTTTVPTREVDVAPLTGRDLATLAAQTFANSCRLFQLQET